MPPRIIYIEDYLDNSGTPEAQNAALVEEENAFIEELHQLEMEEKRKEDIKEFVKEALMSAENAKQVLEKLPALEARANMAISQIKTQPLIELKELNCIQNVKFYISVVRTQVKFSQDAAQKIVILEDSYEKKNTNWERGEVFTEIRKKRAETMNHGFYAEKSTQWAETELVLLEYEASKITYANKLVYKSICPLSMENFPPLTTVTSTPMVFAGKRSYAAVAAVAAVASATVATSDTPTT